MIQIIKGTFGYYNGRKVIPITEADGPQKFDDELEEVATRYGVDASAMRKKADVIAAIEATKTEQPDDDADDEEPPQIGAADPV